MNAQQFIVVEGPPGVGKTTLAQRLAAYFKGTLMLEDTGANPFLPALHDNDRARAFPAQLHFLLNRARQAGERRQHDLFGGMYVADFMLERDRLYAGLNLDEQEFALYEQVYGMLTIDTPAPDLVLYLQAPVDELIARGTRSQESGSGTMSRGYLEGVVQAYARFFLGYQAAPVLIVNAENFHPAERDDDLDMLLQAMMSVRHGRHYFNPAPGVL
ncbi:MAG: deoxynucleoside kinase [Gammaproteobacteria bacterium]